MKLTDDKLATMQALADNAEEMLAGVEPGQNDAGLQVDNALPAVESLRESVDSVTGFMDRLRIEESVERLKKLESLIASCQNTDTTVTA